MSVQRKCVQSSCKWDFAHFPEDTHINSTIAFRPNVRTTPTCVPKRWPRSSKRSGIISQTRRTRKEKENRQQRRKFVTKQYHRLFSQHNQCSCEKIKVRKKIKKTTFIPREQQKEGSFTGGASSFPGNPMKPIGKNSHYIWFGWRRVALKEDKQSMNLSIQKNESKPFCNFSVKSCS